MRHGYSGAMGEPGDQRLRIAAASPPPTPGRGARGGRPWLASPVVAVSLAIGVALMSAAAWAVLRGILELGATSLVVAGLGGWGIGVALRQAKWPALLAAAMGAGAWLLGLILTWLLAMALLPGSSRTFLERVEGTPFIDWLWPQLGLLELAGLVLYAGVAAYAARTPARSRP